MKRNLGFVKRNPRIIKRNPPMTIIFPIKNLGGHLPNPPDTCERKDMWRNFAGVIWIDLSICHTCSIVKACQVRKAYLTAVKEQGIP